MNEHEFIRRLREATRLRSSSARVIAGIGDDAAVIDQVTGRNTVISTDLLIEDVDFRLESTIPQLLGHKALAVSLSDIAAMGARPMWSLLSIGLPHAVWHSNFKDAFIEGYFALADHYGVRLIGGDISRAPDKIVIDSIVIGEVSSGRAITRSGAHPGDQIYVTGTLGSAAAGHRLLDLGARIGAKGLTSLPRALATAPASKRARATKAKSARAGTLTGPEAKAIEYLLKRQLRPNPRVGWGLVLGDEQLASSMIDTSDGLSSDLNHLCSESRAGALIQTADLPIDKNVVKICGRRALDPLLLALNGGEDFELLFTVAPENIARLPKQVDGTAITHIGEINSKMGKVCVAEKNRVWDLKPGGFDHFGRKARPAS